MASFTAVKRIGSGQLYTTLASWEADAPTDYTPTACKQFAADTFATAAFTQGVSLSFVPSGATAKFLDTDSTGPGTGTYIRFEVTGGTPTANDAVTGGIATCVIRGAATFTGCVWQGQINATSDGFTGTTSRLTIAGGTTDVNSYAELTTATGASFADTIQPIRYDQAQGCYITNSGNGYQPVINLNQNYSRLTKLQVYQSGTASAVDNRNTPITLTRCIFEGLSANGSGGNPPFLTTVAATLINCNITQRGSGKSAVAYVVSSVTPSFFYNCTLTVPNDLTAATNFFEGGNNYTTITSNNSNYFGASAFASAITFNHTGDYSNLTGTGVTQVTYNTSAFVNINDATRDFRTVASGTLSAKVSYDATNAPNDIFNTARPTGAGASDPGCFQSATGGGATETFIPLPPPIAIFN